MVGHERSPSGHGEHPPRPYLAHDDAPICPPVTEAPNLSCTSSRPYLGSVRTSWRGINRFFKLTHPLIPNQGEIIQRLLEREVLRHLQEQGAINHNLFYVHFDRNRSADIQAVVQNLTQRNYIEVDKDSVARITTAGIQLLEDSNN